MKIYILAYASHHGFNEIIGVFSTKEKAFDAVKNYEYPFCEECIKEYELDAKKS